MLATNTTFINLLMTQLVHTLIELLYEMPHGQNSNIAVGAVKFVDGRIATISILATIIAYYRYTAVSPLC